MAAYGALLSLSHLLHQILHPPPLYNITIDSQQIQLLQGRIESFVGFLENHPSRHGDDIADLETRIRDAAYAAEDIIESNVIDQILAIKNISTILSQKKINLQLSCEGIEMVLENVVFIEKQKELLTKRVMEGDGDLRLKSAAAGRSPLPDEKTTMVGFDDHLNRVMSELASDESSRRIIPVVGMGGIGKTTLATAVYNNPFIVEHFDIRAWVTISQEYNIQDLLLRLLSEISKSFPDAQKSSDDEGSDEEPSGKSSKYKPRGSNDEPGVRLHKNLFERKFLIVMDDMWDIQAWDKVKMFLPDNENGSRVLVTSRLSNLADDLGSCSPYKMDFLDEEHSWDLFCKAIFAEEDCPVELVESGKYIVERCSGLPLALVLISALLAKSERTREHWESFAREMTSNLNFGNDEQAMKILSLSYTHLPVYLKPCFLYLAMFPEDFEIRVSMLVKLWVAEGLIKPSRDKCLEEIAHKHFEDLVSRNVILVGERGSEGNVKSCKLHDLVRDFCIIQAKTEKFVCIAKLDDRNIASGIETGRRLSVSTTGKPLRKTIKALQSASLNRSWFNTDKVRKNHSYKMVTDEFRLLKVMYENDRDIKLLNQSNLRYVYTYSVSSVLPMALCWNLQTVLLNGQEDLPPEIWLMPQLRHLKIGSFTLPDPPEDNGNVIVLENLQTIKGVEEFKCSEHVLKRIPNLKKLQAAYLSGAYGNAGNFGLHNLAHFKKLESLRFFGVEKLWSSIAFPVSLRKLSLKFCWIPWEDLSIVGSLPNLEVLKLDLGATKGEEWNPIEGQFCRLRFLMVLSYELKIWGAENYHFPCLESLILRGVGLKVIPVSFSDIFPLQMIHLSACHRSMWKSAKEISDEREQLGYEPLLLWTQR